ncbi:hypothetical protein [Martelella sp. HB161492]|uniref:hypothetical protein n=1 Tax=Martelella sp. HB161492 TaxID=2720726 RepID=UPI0015909066|nr:hypothetical protein [Martelella sp. HB161492]
MNVFKFAIGQRVMLSMSKEKGEVIGRAEYLERDPLYYVRYVAGDGRQVEEWISGNAIVADDDGNKAAAAA